VDILTTARHRIINHQSSRITVTTMDHDDDDNNINIIQTAYYHRPQITRSK
jgi:hypothetical protein